MKKIILIHLLILLFVYARGQSGIHFEQNRQWDEILKKAKVEHKYIFVDCYATWCGPCKAMDKDIYPQKKVGNAYNPGFIAIRVQMDKTKNDDKIVQEWYGTADMLSRFYAVNAFPTFLFFDSDGKPVHKAIGYMDAKAFIKLASDARDPNRQYYHLLKDFKPGVLDTAEEKGLARSFTNSDKQLAGRIAADYLTRIPSKQLALPDNGSLMIEFQDNPQVISNAIAYLHSIDRTELTKGVNLAFIGRLRDNPAVKELALNYLTVLRPSELTLPFNVDLAGVFRKDSGVRIYIHNAINHMPENELYEKLHLRLLGLFTDSIGDRGFLVFYAHSQQVDEVIGKHGFAESLAENIIKDASLTPALKLAKSSGTEPDFQKIHGEIERRYHGDYADHIITYGKVSWYLFLVHDKKDTSQWPNLITNRLIQLKQGGYDTLTSKASIGTSGDWLNNICWEIYLHCKDTAQMDTAVKWLGNLLPNNADNFFLLDTYACLLYKAGQKSEGLRWEEKGLDIVSGQKNEYQIKIFATKIAAMKRGEPIWYEKEFQ